MAEIIPGVYRHFKGGVYRVLGTATHSESGEELVIYRKEDDGLLIQKEPQKVWARPAKMWTETVFWHGSEKPRFELLSRWRGEIGIQTTGKWIFGTTMNHGWMKCSECNVSQTPNGCFSYCPNCGAKMDGGQEEE